MAMKQSTPQKKEATSIKNLVRVVQYAWPYRWRFVLSVVCGLAVALLWAANLGTVYPVVSVLYSDQNLQQWAQKRITECETKLSALTEEEAKISACLTQDIEDPERTRCEGRQREIRKERRTTEAHLERDKAWRWFAESFIPHDRFQTLVALLVILVILMMIRGTAYFFQEVLVGSVTNLALFDLRNQLFRKALRQDPAAFDEQGTSEVMARFTNDMQTLGTGLDLIMGQLVREPFRIFACLALACFFSWRLTLMALIVMPLAIVIMSQFARRLRKQARLSLESMSSFYKILQETFQSIKVVKAFNMERYERHRFFREGKNYYHKIMRTVELDSLVSPLNEMLGMLVISGTLLVGTYLLISGKTEVHGIKLTTEQLEAAAMIQFYAALAGLADPCRKLSNLYGRLQRTVAAADRVFDYLDRQPQVVDLPHAAHLTKCKQGIEFDLVRFTYPRRSDPALRDISLYVPAGQTVALVGPNGCGKSTIVNLLARFYDPQQGSIRIDGTDIRQVKLRSLRRQIGLVTQETALFDDTIFNNIAHGNRHAAREKIIEVAKQAFAHDFIMNLPQNYDTFIGEHGARLSGGQRQRIALARAFLRDPSILILDEATSAVDVESEVLIQRALEKFRRGRTTLIISHRLSVLSLVDRIFLLDHGIITAEGTDNELVQSSPAYRRLRELYFQESGSRGADRLSA
jgi:ABC-type multidrug transport system fused ATPase/permease subunit